MKNVLCVASFALCMTGNAAQANNDEFLSMISGIQGSVTVYDCDVEVAFERIISDCAQSCLHRLYMLVGERGTHHKQLLVGTFLLERHALDTSHRRVEYNYQPTHLLGVNSIVGYLTTDADGNILEIRLQIRDELNLEFVTCRGEHERRTTRRRSR